MIDEGRFAALNSAPYRRYIVGSLASVGGTQLTMLGQGWLVFELSHSALDLGLLGAAGAVPNILVSLFGGALADRLDRRLVIMATSALTAVLLLALALLDASGTVAVWHVLAVAALGSLVSGIDWPTRQALFPHLIDRAHMMSAVALNSMVWQGTRMVMPAIGGLLIAITDTSVVFVIAAIGNLAMLAVVASLSVTLPPANTTSTLEQVREGFRFILDTRIFFVLIALTFIAMFFSASYVQLLPAFAPLLAINEQGYGFIISASGVGAVAGTLLAGSLQRSPHLGRLMLAASAANGLLVLAFCGVAATGTAWAFPLALLASLGTGVTSSLFLIMSMTVLQLEVPERLRGRVMGVHGISYSCMSLGALAAGGLAEHTGPPLAVAVGAGVHVAAVAWVWTRERVVRQLSGRPQGQAS